MKNVNTPQLRKEVKAEINSARIVPTEKIRMGYFDRTNLKYHKSIAEPLKGIRIR